MDKLDRAIKQKKFFKVIFGDLIGEGGNLKDNQYIRVFQNKDDFSKVEFFNNIDDLVNYTSNRGYINTYFTLSTTNGEGGTEKDLIYRSVLGFDFDKKDLGENFSYKDIIERFKSLGIWYHIMTDSGHGFHVYMCVEPTQDLQKVMEVQKALGKLLGADLNALKSTQVLRVPYSHNTKKDKAKRVNIIKMFDRDTIKRYDINRLYDRFCRLNFKDTGDRLSQYNIKSSNIPLCVKNALENGSEDGFKNLDLFNIVIYLKHKGENISYIKKVACEWNNKNKTQVNKNRLDYQIEYIFNNCNGYRCSNCRYNKIDCKSYTVSDFNLEQYGEPILNIHTKIGRQCRNSKRKGVICMSGNELFIYNVLLNNKDLNLNIDEIMELITDRKTGKQALNSRTVRKALKELADKEYIIINKGNPRKGIKDTYKINPKKIDNTNTFRLTYFINLAVIWGRITTTELRCYVHMRYLHHKQVLDGKAKGNIFTITIEDLAKDMGYSSLDKVKTMLKNLYDNNILDRRAIPKADNPKIFYYQYKLNM